MMTVHKLPSIISASALLFLGACSVDEDYKITSDTKIDTEMTVFGEGVSMPIGSSKPITLNDLLDIDDYSVLKTADDGSYYISLTSDEPTETSISLEGKLDFNANSSTDFDFTPIPIPSGIDLSSYSADIPQDVSTTIDIDAQLPDEVIEVSRLELASSSIEFTASASAAFTLKQGFTFELPSCLELEAPDGACYAVSDGHIVKVTADYKGSNLSFNLSVKAINIASSDIKDGAIAIKGAIKAKGDVNIKGSDLNSGISSLNIGVHTDFSLSGVESVTGRVEFSTAYDVDPITIDAMPDVLDGAEIILSDPDFSIVISNSSPVSLVIDPITITAYKEGEEVCSFEIARTTVEPEGDTPIVIPSAKAAEMISKFPDQITVSRVQTSILPDNEITVNADDELKFGLDYLVCAFLAFEEGSHLLYDFTIEDVALDLSGYDVGAELKFNAASTIPLDMVVDAVALDASGNVIPDACSIDATVMGGKTGSESVTPVSISLKSTSTLIQDIRIMFAAYVGSEFAGVPLACDQYLQLRDIVAELPEGVTINSNE